VVEHHPITARPIGRWGRLVRWMRREPRQALLAGSLAAAALFVAVSVGALLASREKAQVGELASRANEIEDTLLRAFLELGEGRHEVAYRTFERVLALDQECDEARVGRVLVLLWQGGRDEEVLALLRDEPLTPAYEGLRALALGGPPPSDDPEWLAKASAHELFLDGERLRIESERRPRDERNAWLSKALERYDEAVLRSTQPRALYQHVRGWVASSLGDAKASRSAANALAKLWPDSAIAQYQAGASLVDLDPQAALPHLRRAAELDPQRLDTFLCLGNVGFKLGELDLARAALEHALELDPASAAAYNGLACVLGGLGCVDEQREALETALSFDPDAHSGISHSALSNLALLEWQAGNLGAASRAMELLLERQPWLAEQRALYAVVLSQQGHPGHALVQMEIALAATPRSGSQWLEYSKHSLLAGELENALEAVQVARSLEPELPDLDAIEAQVRSYLER
jgi:tetratricopeptide (TPR) repeat protein